jgi:hypothetical protein
LAHDVHAEDGLGDALVLYLGGMLEAAVDDGPETFRFENEVLEPGGMDADVVSPRTGVERERVQFNDATDHAQMEGGSQD